MAAGWLAIASLIFYGYWNVAYVPLLILSILFNFIVGVSLAAAASRRKLMLTVGVAANLLLLAYYKYADFLASNNKTPFDHWISAGINC